MAGIIDVVDALAVESDITKVKARQFLDDTLMVIQALTDAGESVTLRGFGTFKVKKRAARTGRNPATGETIQIPEKSTLTFKAAK